MLGVLFKDVIRSESTKAEVRCPIEHSILIWVSHAFGPELLRLDVLNNVLPHGIVSLDPVHTFVAFALLKKLSCVREGLPLAEASAAISCCANVRGCGWDTTLAPHALRLVVLRREVLKRLGFLGSHLLWSALFVDTPLVLRLIISVLLLLRAKLGISIVHSIAIWCCGECLNLVHCVIFRIHLLYRVIVRLGRESLRVLG